uniref:Uncharacterized protein n=1 Tax=Tanacetum cinerariifolium TaxID=118510 RepID=A0A6L2KIS2_TANCI|nr:hypothetical protein [Tanacetum cinerariifolium]
MPPKRDLRLIDEHFESVSVNVSNVSSSSVMTVKTVDANHNGMFSKEEPKPIKNNNFSPPIIEDWVSKSEEEDEPKFQKQVHPSFPKIKFVKAKDQNQSFRKPVKQVEQAKSNTHRPRGNQRNWNNLMNQILEILMRSVLKGLTPHLKIGTSSRRSLGKDDASKQGRNLKQRSIFEERDFDVQAMMETNYKLAKRLRAEEQR